MKNSLVAAALLMATTSTGAHATVIDFATDTNANLFFGAYTQNGFTITNLSAGGASARLVNNGPVFGDVLIGIATSATVVSLTRVGGGLFSLNSFLGGSGSSSPATVTYDLAGFLNSANTYNQSLTGATTNGFNLSTGSFTLTPTPAKNLFDKVTFTLKSSTGSSLLDDIDVTAVAAPTPDPVVPPAAAAVPEPATWAMMLLGFGVLGTAMRRHPARALRPA